MAVFDSVSMMLTGADEAEQLVGASISRNLLPLLGVQPVKGRSFSTEEAEQRQRLVLISHRFWQARFGGSNDAIGATIELDGLPSQVIGILPAGFQIGTFDADVWQPHTMSGEWNTRYSGRGGETWFVVGRLRPNVTFDQAQAEMSAIARRLDEQLPTADRNRGVSVVPLSLHVIGSRSRLALWMLAGAVCCVLLIAAANVASLSLARSVGRQRRFQTSLLTGFSVVALLMAAIGIYGLIQYSIATRTREIGLRMAIGAQAGDIFRMIIGEGLTLSLMGLALGLVGALWVTQAGSSLLFGVTATDPLTFIAVSLLLTVVATAACFFPARRAMKVEPSVALQQE